MTQAKQPNHSKPSRPHGRVKKVFAWGIYITAGLFSLILLAGLALYWWWDRLPYQSYAARQLVAALESRGLNVHSLEVEQLTEEQAVLRDITLGEDQALRIAELNAQYRWQEAIEGRLQQLTMQELRIRLYNQDTEWKIAGLEPLFSDAPTDSKASALPSLPFNHSELASMLPGHTTLKDGTLTVTHAPGQLSLPFHADLQLSPEASFTLESPKLSGKQGEVMLSSGPVTLSAKLNAEAQVWAGDFSLKNLQITGAPAPLPLLTLTGNVSLSQQQFMLKATASDATKSHGGAFSLNTPFADTRKGKITVSRLHFPWGGGIVRTKNVTLPLQGRAPIPITLELEAIELAQVLDTVGGEKVTGTGRISGSLPITWHANGKITLQQGIANALEAGTLSVSPDALPGNREEMQTVRTALENFHYTSLKITVSSDEQDQSVIILNVSGNNPDAFNGRQVNLNVTLSGDVLPLLQQSILPFQDIQTWLKQQDGTP